MAPPTASRPAAHDLEELERGAAREHIGGRSRLEELDQAAEGCTACDLYRHATQTVFGEGETQARIMLAGEQPGDREDLEGRPFVGPAGALLDRALEEAGIERGEVYVTNVVKHFKWEARGKRRIHKRPNAAETAACVPWLAAEIRAVRPRVLVALGATAAQALISPRVRVTRDRGSRIESPLAPHVLVTVHPSSILRAEPGTRQREYEAFVADLQEAARLAAPDTSR
jgi:DNA polymerase